MSTSYSPKIVTDGLSLCLDAKNTKSYPGSGANWADLSGNSYDATLTTTSFSNGAIVFNGSTSLCRTTLPVSVLDANFTVCVFFKTDGSVGTEGSYSDRLISADHTSGGTKWCIGINNSGEIGIGGDGGGEGETTYPLTVGTYYFCALVVYSTSLYDFFLNDDKKLDGEGIGIAAANFGNVSVGCRPNGTDRVFGGSVAWVVAYNRVLTDSEVLQNYDALKGRFGL